MPGNLVSECLRAYRRTKLKPVIGLYLSGDRACPLTALALWCKVRPASGGNLPRAVVGWADAMLGESGRTAFETGFDGLGEDDLALIPAEGPTVRIRYEQGRELRRKLEIIYGPLEKTS